MLSALLSILLTLSPPATSDSVVEWLGPIEIELGEIPYREPALVRFPYRNITDRPLTIDNIRTGCGCTAPDWSDEPVMPGDTSVVLIEYDAAKAGYFRQWIRVFFHGQRKPERLWIEGQVMD
jgi:hypothetical protein